ncbi:AAA family ATPase, partial [Lachnospiraceae bacterium CLA-AA-H58]|uniref:AAA family ATPase n=1 Tax=Pilosibacter fragilis TaxID=3078042 RepID=UPI0032D5516F
MNYTQPQIDRANAVSLEDFLRTQGETLIKSGREYRWKEHDSLTVRGNKWFRHSQSKGGYPIDFVMEFYGKSFPEAVQLLTGESGEGQTEAATAPPTAFHLPLHNRTADRAIQYLTESRGLNKTLVEAFLLSGDIYEDAKRHNVVFVGRDRSGTPRYAHVRGTADPFRQDIVGSDKSYPFRYEGNGNQLFAFESPIDLLSFICLYPQDWQTRSYLALGGVSGKALDRFLSERKDTRKVFLCLDSDTAGSEACTRLAQSIPGEIAVIRLVPARKDWNDVLRQQGDIPSRKFIAETITLRELPTAQPVPMLRMADVELTSVDWLWFPYIPFGKLTIIQGNPGEGKTYFAMRLAAACTNRKPLPGMETLEPFNIIYQTAEDGLGDTVKPRLMEAEADLERVLVIDDRDTPLTLADERIARAIRENNARLVIIDPVQAFLGADVDMNRANEVRPIFRSLGDISQATGCAIVLIGHLNKAAGTQSTYRGLGSIDITAAVRSLLFIGKLKDSPTT